MKTSIVRLLGNQEVPPVRTAGCGLAIVSLVGNTLRWKITFSGLSSKVISTHFHGPAEPGMNAGVQVDIGANSNQVPPFNSPLIGNAQLLLGSDQIKQLVNGLWYINVHTVSYPDGEIRGQVNKRVYKAKKALRVFCPQKNRCKSQRVKKCKSQRVKKCKKKCKSHKSKRRHDYDSDGYSSDDYDSDDHGDDYDSDDYDNDYDSDDYDSGYDSDCDKKKVKSKHKSDNEYDYYRKHNDCKCDNCRAYSKFLDHDHKCSHDGHH